MRNRTTYFHPYYGNQLTKKEIQEVLFKLIKRRDYLETIKNLKYQKRYLSITSYAANRIGYLKRKAKEAEKKGDTRSLKFFQLIEKLEKAKFVAENRILKEKEKRQKRIEEIQNNYDPNTGLIIPVKLTISPELAPKPIKDTIVEPSAPSGSKYNPPKTYSKIYPSNEG